MNAQTIKAARTRATRNPLPREFHAAGYRTVYESPRKSVTLTWWHAIPAPEGETGTCTSGACIAS